MTHDSSLPSDATPKKPLPRRGVLVAGIVLSAGLAVGLAMLARDPAPTDVLGTERATLETAGSTQPPRDAGGSASAGQASVQPDPSKPDPSKQDQAKQDQSKPADPKREAKPTAQPSPAVQQASDAKAKPAGDNSALPAPVRLGERVGKLDATFRTLPVLVLVSDAQSYLDAIAAWTPTRRFPVLIDDGSVLATDNIARFARAFAPKQIVRWKSDSIAQVSAMPTPLDVRRALAGAWDVDKSDLKSMLDAWIARGHVPPGIVVMNQAADDAWPAALALAAARGQPVFDTPMTNAVSGAMSVAEADALAATIEGFAQSTGLKWNAEGDELDAITLAGHTPGRIDIGDKGFLALTDRLGRHAEGKKLPPRWAWCGQVFGTPSEAAYRAMAAIFTRPTMGFFFDGYENKSPFNLYDATKASEIAREAGLSIELNDAPAASASAWRARAARSFEAGLVLVNSHGNPSDFNLNPGVAIPGDLPLLSKPAGVHFIHSFSAMFPGNRDTVAGRWLERGAYFYVGSVHEPFLSAFLPTPTVTARLLSGAAYGAAVRVERPDLWKVTVLGDPLTTVLPAATIADEPLPLEGATALDADLRQLLLDKKFGEAFRILALQGRDRDLARLFVAALAKDEAAIESAAAKWAIPALARTDDVTNLALAYAKLTNADASDRVLRDCLWVVGSARLAQPSDALIAAMSANLRAESLGRDAAMIAATLERTKGKPASDAFVERVRSSLSDKAAREQLDDALAKRSW
jgi:hypothetical protein